MTAGHSDDRRRLGWLLAGVGMLSVSTDSLWVRVSEAGAMDVAFLVSCCALVVHSTFGRWFDRRPALESFWTHPVLVMGVGVLASVSNLCFITAITETRVANVVAIVAAAPLMASLCARLFLGEPITRRVAVAIALTMVGIGVGFARVAARVRAAATILAHRAGVGASMAPPAPSWERVDGSGPSRSRLCAARGLLRGYRYRVRRIGREILVVEVLRL